MPDDANRRVGVGSLGLEGDRFYPVDQRRDPNPGIDKAQIGYDDSGLRASNLLGKEANTPVNIGPAMLRVKNIVRLSHS